MIPAKKRRLEPVREFLDAARKGDVEALAYGLEHGINVNKTLTKGSNSAVMIAAQNGRCDAVKFLIERGASLGMKNATALHFLAYYGLHELMDYFIDEKRCDINAQTAQGSSALILALEGLDRCLDQPIRCLEKENKFVQSASELLRRRDIDVNIQNRHGLTALHYAVNCDHGDVVRDIIARDAKFLKDKEGKSPVDFVRSDSIDAILQAKDILSGIIEEISSAQPLVMQSRTRVG